jgi:hypothetical protein
MREIFAIIILRIYLNIIYGIVFGSTYIMKAHTNVSFTTAINYRVAVSRDFWIN